MTKDGYPTAAELRKLKKIAGKTPLELFNTDHREIIEYIRSIWWQPDWGFKLSGKNKLKLELHCGGWSGNEEIIGVLEDSWFWAMYWQMTKRGGHYWFEIDLKRYLPKK